MSDAMMSRRKAVVQANGVKPAGDLRIRASALAYDRGWLDTNVMLLATLADALDRIAALEAQATTVNAALRYKADVV